MIAESLISIYLGNYLLFDRKMEVRLIFLGAEISFSQAEYLHCCKKYSSWEKFDSELKFTEAIGHMNIKSQW